MKVIMARHYGMCFGVRDALGIIHRAAESGPATVLGELVHNPVVRADLRDRGVAEGRLEDLGSVATDRVVITAHGASGQAREKWRASGREVIDTTCPLVWRAHLQLARLVKEGYAPVVVGQRDHVEVRGLTGDYPDAAVILRPEEATGLPERARYGVISQTTQPWAQVRAVVEAIRQAQPDAEVKWCDTVCQPTKDRQLSLDELCRQARVIVVIGGRNSNNTRQLASAARARGCGVHHVESVGDLREEWFDGVDAVGLTAGTSTLEGTVVEVRRWLERVGETRRQETGDPAVAGSVC